MELNPEILGWIGATLTTVSFVPQALHILRTRQTAGISLAMYLVFFIGVCCWAAYGFWLGALPIILANVITLVLVALIIVLKLRHG